MKKLKWNIIPAAVVLLGVYVLLWHKEFIAAGVLITVGWLMHISVKE